MNNLSIKFKALIGLPLLTVGLGEWFAYAPIWGKLPAITLPLIWLVALPIRAGRMLICMCLLNGDCYDKAAGWAKFK